ncbi:hypothetical protein CERSUDRAFT_132849 [Gelatoporia subvermispora B]|uniref:Uncharacterized protein n=1 Tax=Ceriporiopsis subvermispora (strain B) TaxID=914234 RepID=M2R648_CERS8|nr:hypothetical protein CERSUDRAFT_132849 [Gelatoporia subvermispora B]
MGRSAKFHKRAQKQKKATSAPSVAAFQAPVKATAAHSAPAEQKKRANLKAKAGKARKDAEGRVLGGADYVELMFGSRRKALEEAAKLPRDEE